MLFLISAFPSRHNYFVWGMLPEFRDTLNMTNHVSWLSQLPMYQWKTLEFVNHTSLSDVFRVLCHGIRYIIQVYLNICGLVLLNINADADTFSYRYMLYMLQSWIRVARSTSNDPRGSKWLNLGIRGRETFVPGDHSIPRVSKSWINNIQKRTPTTIVLG